MSSRSRWTHSEESGTQTSGMVTSGLASVPSAVDELDVRTTTVGQAPSTTGLRYPVRGHVVDGRRYCRRGHDRERDAGGARPARRGGGRRRARLADKYRHHTRHRGDGHQHSQADDQRGSLGPRRTCRADMATAHHLPGIRVARQRWQANWDDNSDVVLALCIGSRISHPCRHERTLLGVATGRGVPMCPPQDELGAVVRHLPGSSRGRLQGGRRGGAGPAVGCLVPIVLRE